MARDEYEYPSQRIGKPTAADIWRIVMIRQNNDDGTLAGIQWEADFNFRDRDGNNLKIMNHPQMEKFRCNGMSVSYPPPIADIVAAAVTTLEAMGFTVVGA